ncbi:MAG: LysM peptidoglycan-binding domain-containing protein [bacterium]
MDRMKPWMSCMCAVCGLALLSGCQYFDGTPFELKPDPKVTKLAISTQQTNNEVRHLAEQMAEINRNQIELDMRVQRLEAKSSGGSSTEEIAAIKRDIAMIRAERETLKKEITDDLVARIDKVVSRSGASAPSSKPSPTSTNSARTRSGYNHTVEKGQTLSEIARGYGKTLDVIMKANNLKTSNTIRPGQVLFIPD